MIKKKRKLLIAGSRGIKDYGLFLDKLYAGLAELGLTKADIAEVVSGTASGVDKFGEQWAMDEAIKIARFPADWKKYPKAAGHIRNEEMIEYIEPYGVAIFVWNGESSGTKGCIKLAKAAKIKHSIQII